MPGRQPPEQLFLRSLPAACGREASSLPPGPGGDVWVYLFVCLLPNFSTGRARGLLFPARCPRQCLMSWPGGKLGCLWVFYLFLLLVFWRYNCSPWLQAGVGICYAVESSLRSVGGCFLLVPRDPCCSGKNNIWGRAAKKNNNIIIILKKKKWLWSQNHTAPHRGKRTGTALGA